MLENENFLAHKRTQETLIQLHVPWQLSNDYMGGMAQRGLGSDGRPAVHRYGDKWTTGRKLQAADLYSFGMSIEDICSRVHSLAELKAAGATEVVPELLESSLLLASHALNLLGLAEQQVQARVNDVRQSRYRLLHGCYPHASSTQGQINPD